MIRGIFRALLGALALTAFIGTPAFAGNIALTGHDDDFHCTLEDSNNIAGDACLQISQLLAFVRAGSPTPGLKVLSFDQNPPVAGGTGTLLTTELTALLGAGGFDNISTAAGVTAALFDPTKYSAFVVASDSTCGGCDNSTSMTTALSTAAVKTAIANFFNAGGGVFAMTGGDNAATYYSFLPVSAVGAGSPPSSGFVGNSSCFGTAVTGVNGDATHNFFAEPGTGGVSPLFCVAERNTTVGLPNATTLLLKGGSIVTSVITTSAVPEPATLSLLGLGLAAAIRRRRRS